jgi:hypothetical protein
MSEVPPYFGELGSLVRCLSRFPQNPASCRGRDPLMQGTVTLITVLSRLQDEWVDPTEFLSLWQDD